MGNLDDGGGPPQLERTLRGHTGWVNTAMFSPDSSVLLTSAADMTARFWCTGTGALLRTFRGHNHFVRTAVFSPDLTRVLTSSFDWTAKLWSADEDTALQTFAGHEAAVNSAFFSGCGKMAISTSRDYTARLWSIKNGACLQIIRGHTNFVVWAVFAPAGHEVAPTLVKNAAEQWSFGISTRDRARKTPEICNTGGKNGASKPVEEPSSENEHTARRSVGQGGRIDCGSRADKAVESQRTRCEVGLPLKRPRAASDLKGKAKRIFGCCSSRR